MMKKNAAMLISIVLVLAIASVLALGFTPVDGSGYFGKTSNTAKTASGYAEIFAAVKKAGRNQSLKYAYSGAIAPTGVEDRAEAEAPLAMPTEAAAADYSDTNTQVDGVDESDIIKTDGEYIYILRGEELVIAKAQGVDTSVVSRIKLVTTENGSEGYPSEIYVSGDRLVVVMSTYGYYAMNDSIAPYSGSRTMLYVYDISDRQQPVLSEKLGQDGNYLTSRMVDGTVYLISLHTVYDDNISASDPSTFVPSVYRGDKRAVLESECVVIWPPYDWASYTVIASYNISECKLIASQSVLGGSSEVYMNLENLYISKNNYYDGAGESYSEGIYKVTQYNAGNKTEISRFSLNGGNISFEAVGSVDGTLLNQFSMDEHNGNLRVVTTMYKESYKIYEDKTHGWSNYLWEESINSNALYVLSPSMEVIGSITNIAENERVYSVRFDGDVGYFVTFRETDPLFTVDLKDPENPVILSALKIPGFSQYLHVYGDGRLFGFGREADESTGIAEGLKLSMFDTSDPADVTEKHKLVLNDYYSEALYNHKAILIAPSKDIIAFPVDSGYDIYGYSDESGFYKRAHVDLGNGNYYWGGGVRGMYIGDFAYICSSEQIDVFDLSTLSGVAQIKL